MDPIALRPITVYRDERLPDYAKLVLPALARDPVVSNVAAAIVSERLAGIRPAEPDGWWLRACDPRFEGPAEGQ